MANNVNETRKRAFEALCNYHRYREAGLSERQIADLFGIRSIATFRLFRVILRYYAAHECSVALEDETEEAKNGT